ncbi:MAG: hypothetical protein K6A44_04010 [bacterium]|nr:hypothetical protein [bacterium]
MTTKSKKQNTVPFDPGFAPYVLVFSITYDYMQIEVRKFKNATQRKMKYKSLEGPIMRLCDNLIAFYFGCMLYGGYLKNKYKSQVEISGNDFLGANIDECKSGDVMIEVLSLEKFIKNNDKNPFATKKINPVYAVVIDSYKEFLDVNEYFTNVKFTSDIKLPKAFSFMDNFSDDQIDDVFETINGAIDSKKIEKLLNSSYFELLK